MSLSSRNKLWKYNYLSTTRGDDSNSFVCDGTLCPLLLKSWLLDMVFFSSTTVCDARERETGRATTMVICTKSEHQHHHCFHHRHFNHYHCNNCYNFYHRYHHHWQQHHQDQPRKNVSLHFREFLRERLWMWNRFPQEVSFIKHNVCTLPPNALRVLTRQPGGSKDCLVSYPRCQRP